MRGGAEQFMEETERSLHDAIMIVRRAIKNDAVVAGIVCVTHSCLSSIVLGCTEFCVLKTTPQALKYNQHSSQ